MEKIKSLPYTDTFKTCDLSDFKFKTTEDIEICKEMLGQDRAINSVMVALGVEKNGYNAYLSGESGLGKKTFIKSLLKDIAKDKAIPNDWCYVYNFDNPKEPRAIEIAPGRGKELKKDMEDLISILKTNIPKAFESKEFENQQNEISEEYSRKKEELFNELREFAKSKNMQVQFTPTGILTIPLVNNKPMTQEQYAQLTEEEKKDIQKRRKEVDNKVSEIYQQTRKLDKENAEKINELQNNVASFTVKGFIENVKDKYKDNEQIIEYLKSVHTDIVNNIDKFLPQQQQGFMGFQPSMAMGGDYGKALNEYDVNVFIDNSRSTCAPVIVESHPNYINLFGTIERELVMGAMVTNFTLIRDGSICRANGGYLVVDVYDILKFPYVWDTLKKVLENGELRVEDMHQHYGYSTGPGLRPEPVKLDVKVLMTGPRYIYNLLYSYDPDFKKLFKIKAEFDTVIDWEKDNVDSYACVIKSICENENLRNFDKSGVEAVIEHSSRLADDQDKLSVQFGKISKVLVESDYWASSDNSKYIERKHVEKAVEEKIYRSKLVEDKIQEMIQKGNILVSTEGEVVGQINGLAIYNTGDYMFGKPSRITCETFMGSEGVVNIERKAKLSGNIHDKGVLILGGYLGAKYAQTKPLSLSASIGFEQSYSIVDGDSASAAELIVLLSSLAEVPIRQNFAITGSVNQKGIIQPIGGVNEKIEGFYETCKARELTGDHGVIIPVQNIKNLMLKKEVVEAVKQKNFHIYPIETIDEGLELLTGRKAGKMKKDKKYEKDSVNYLVDQKLEQLAKEIRKYGKTGRNNNEKDEE